jgi:hypothetical protein
VRADKSSVLSRSGQRTHVARDAHVWRQTSFGGPGSISGAMGLGGGRWERVKQRGRGVRTVAAPKQSRAASATPLDSSTAVTQAAGARAHSHVDSTHPPAPTTARSTCGCRSLLAALPCRRPSSFCAQRFVSSTDRTVHSIPATSAPAASAGAGPGPEICLG